MSRSIEVSVAGWLAALLLLVAGSPAAAQAPKSGGTLRAALRAEVSTFDVHKGASGSDHMYLYPVFDTLVRFDDKLNPRPGLAESWETPDPKTLVLKLRKSVKFHDGTPFNAEAVRFNLARAQDRQTSSMASELTSIEQVEVVDSHTVRLRLKAPDASLILAFTDRAGMMLSPTAVQKLGDQFGRQPVGAGEFRMARWQPGSEVRMERFADYYEPGRPYLDAILFRIIPDADTRVSALRSGQVDFIMEVPAQDFASLKGERNLRAIEGRLGIKVDLKPMDLAKGVQSFFRGKELMAANYRWTGRPDPDQSVRGMFHSTGFYNPGGYKVPRIEELMDQAKATYRLEDRRRLYQQLSEVVQQEAMDTGIYAAYSLEAMSVSLQGYQPNFLGKPMFRGAWLQAK